MERNSKNVLVFWIYLFIGNHLIHESFADRTIGHRLGTRSAKSEDQFTCKLPPHPENGKWSIIPTNVNVGELISINTILKFECNSGYKLAPDNPYMICDRNWNIARVPECEKLCPAMFNTSTTSLKCVDKNGRVISCQEPTEGSILTYECAPYYETPFGFKKTILCTQGTWSYPRPVCQPICGRKVNDDAVPLIYGGKIQQGLEFPWIAAIYKKNGEYVNVCGGSIISQKIVLTAAHCVTNDYGELLSMEDYVIGAGKFYNKYNDTRDKEAQYSKISRAVVHPGYKGNSRRYLADLAVLVLKESLTLTYLVQPICFNDVNNVHLHAGNVGVVSGWGVQDDGLPSEELRKLEIPYKHETVCAQELPREWADKYNTLDKICAGFFNKNMSVCRGDSGNGLAFKNPDDNRYYIHGLVSIGPSERGECNIQQNSLYTKVAFYYDFIDRELSKYNIDDCKLPPYPKNGFWSVAGQDKYPGSTVPATTVLKITCKPGLILSSESSSIQCQQALFNMPTCELVCQMPNFPPKTITACRNQRGEDIYCSKAIKNSVLTFTCPEGYTAPKGSTGNSICLGDGTWETPTPQCQEGNGEEEKPVAPAGTKQKVICTYASWEAHNGVNPEDFDASLCSHMVYAFVGLWPNGKLKVEDRPLDLGGDNKGLYHRVTEMKTRNENLKVLLSVGGAGATNASLFSSMAADPAKRSAFIDSAKEFLQTYHFDGLDIEWHVPEANDKENYITLLRKVKEAFKPHGWLLTATVRSHPEDTGYDGGQMNEILDWVTVKTYDMYGDWSQYTGQNSALYPSSVEYDWEKNHLNVDAAAKNWLANGVTKRKMVLSIAFYGRSFRLSDANDHGVHAPILGAGPGKGGILKYSEICSKYANWTRYWDDEQKNPYKHSGDNWIGYDDKDSVLAKAIYVKENNYLGVNVWPIDGDDVHGKCGSKQILLKQVYRGLSGSTPRR